MNKYLKIVFITLALCGMQHAFAQQEVDTVDLNTTRSFEVLDVQWYTYSWWFINPAGEKTTMSSISHSTAEHLWDTEGAYWLYVQATDTSGCLSEIISKKFVVRKKASINLIVSAGNDTIVGSCNPYQIHSSVNETTGITYLWEPSDYLDDPSIANPVFTPGETTTYKLTVTASDGTKAVDTVTVTVSGVTAEAGDDFTAESGTNVYLDGSGSTGRYIKYSWTTTDGKIINAENTSSPEIGDGGVYYLEVTDTFGCSSIDSLTVTWKDQLIVSAGNDTIVGSCNPYQIHSSVNETTGITYLWEPSDYLDDPSIANPVFTPGETTTYKLTVTASDGTRGVDTVTVTVSGVTAEAGDDFTAENGTNVYLDGSGSTGKDLQYLWTTNIGNIVDGENSVSPEISDGGVYYLEVTDAFGCSAADSIIIKWITDAPEDWYDRDTTSYNTPVSVTVLDNDDPGTGGLKDADITIITQPQNGTVTITDDNEIIYTPDEEFTGDDYLVYRVCESEYKCYNVYVYIRVKEKLFFIPQAFSPNGDGINDYFEILGVDYYPNNSLTVINRWGKTVYKAKHYGIETSPQFWDGICNQTGGNEELPTGTYFYVFDLGNGEKRIAGYVYIDR